MGVGVSGIGLGEGGGVGDRVGDRVGGLAHVMQQRSAQQVFLLVACPDQRVIDVQAMALVAAGHPHKEGCLRRRQALVDVREFVCVDAGKRRPVRPGTVNLALDAFRIVCNWACRWRVDGRPVLDRNPSHRLPYLDDPNRRRNVWTHDRFESVLAAAEGLTMQVEWHGKRERMRCYLADLLVIAEATSRRIGAVCQLRYCDLPATRGLLL